MIAMTRQHKRDEKVSRKGAKVARFFGFMPLCPFTFVQDKPLRELFSSQPGEER